MGVTIPLSGVMLLTLVGNLILHLRIKSYEAKQVSHQQSAIKHKVT
jgi:hypothetical protein